MAKIKTPFVRDIPIDERFLRHVRKNKQKGSCWYWTSVTASCGRGLFRMKPGRWLKAHLAAKVIFHNEERPEGTEGHHTCLNSKCVNPNHVVFLSKDEHRAEHRRLKEIENENME